MSDNNFELEVKDIAVFERLCALIKGENPYDKQLRETAKALRAANKKLKTAVESFNQGRENVKSGYSGNR